jgi:two-component system cell cycle sensor histidine kinase/response regulator CckA
MVSAAVGAWEVRRNAILPLLKSLHWREALLIAGALVILTLLRLKHRAARDLRMQRSIHRYRWLFESNPHPMWVFDHQNWRFLEVNDAAVELYGYSREEFLHMTIRDIRPPEEVPRLAEAMRHHESALRDFGVWRHLKKDGTPLDVEISACALEFGMQRQCLVLASDVTQKRRLEAELQQARKLEALGRLAGGVAHDFNNLMMIVSSYAEMLRREPLSAIRLNRHVDRILQATQRASSLTQQLLAFSRNQMLAPKVIELNSVLEDVLGLVKRLVGEGIEVRFLPDPELRPIKIDIGQLTQVILNLSANARDAMTQGGTLCVSTAGLTTSGIALRGNGHLPAGEYSTLKVIDTGSGMSSDVQERIFEPFFTTKDRGKGSGLGLATVYGIVKQSGGYIGVESMLGRGTEFTLYFPCACEDPVQTGPFQPQSLETGHELVMVVEDEAQLRGAVVESLRSLGYRVVHARDGRHAMQVAESLAGLDVLVSDVVMPYAPGTEVARYVRRKFPEVKTILMSGYADGSVKAEDLDQQTLFLTKPLSLSTLAKHIRALMLQQPV